ncbi:MAG: hypothetical protein LBB23_02170 [Rickettsiales bacterium]|jgi:phosphoribosylglycinamide formyltransferase-1|nr:hypothetical protein [Rickettsiales bacterium]
MTKEILILASGNGSNAEAIVQYARRKALPINFTAGCNRSPDKAGVYDKMNRLFVQTYHLPTIGKGYLSCSLLDFLDAAPKFDLIMLAGYMKIIPSDITENNNMLNIHPSILPFNYKGSLDAYSDALTNGDTRTGCTIHKVSPDVDGGQIIAQIGFNIPPNIELDTLKAIGLAHEHALYPAVMEAELFGAKLDMVDIARRIRELLCKNGLGEVMHGCNTIIPDVRNGRKFFSEFNGKGR